MDEQVLDVKIEALSNRVERLEQGNMASIEMQKAIATITVQLATLTNKVDALNEKVDELERKPGKRWDTLIAAVISAVVGLCIGLLSHGV